MLRLFPSVSSASPVEAWSVTCYLETGRSRTAIREWKGEGFLPEEIRWAGDVSDSVLTSGEKLIFEFRAVNAAGQSSVVRSPPVQIGSFFSPEAARSLDLRGVFAISDSFRDNGFSAEGERLLDEVASAFGDLSGYELRVRVFLSFQGEEEANLLRSERLARRIRDALVERGVPPGAAFFRGEGETSLLSESDDEFSFYKNNRIILEFRHVQQSE